MKKTIVILTAILMIAVSSCNDGNHYVNKEDANIKANEFEYDGRTYIMFTKGIYMMGVVEKHETDGCDNN